MLSLEQFYKYKEQLMAIYEEVKNNPSFEDELALKYHNVEKELFEYDLSQIPFEAWSGMTIFFENIMDFSLNRANFDFALFEEFYCEYASYKGCNLKNVDKLSDYHERQFDRDYVLAHPEFFPDPFLPAEVKNRFYNKALFLEDIFKYPSLRTCARDKHFAHLGVKICGIQNIIKFSELYPKLFNELLKENFFRYGITSGSKENLSYEEAEILIFNSIIDVFRKSNLLTALSFKDLIPEKMKKLYSRIFTFEKDLPEEIIESYYYGGLDLPELRAFSHLLKNNDITIGIRKNNVCMQLAKSFGDIWGYIDNIPPILDNAFYNYVSHYNELPSLNGNNETIIKTVIDYDIYGYHYQFGEKSLEKVQYYCQYYPIEDVVDDEFVCYFLQNVGIDSVIEYEKTHNYVLTGRTFESYYGTLLHEVARYAYKTKGEIDNLEKYIYEAMYEIRKDQDNSLASVMAFGNNREIISSLFPNDFINDELLSEKVPEIAKNKGLLRDLSTGINGNIELLLSIIEKYPKVLEVIKDIKLVMPHGAMFTFYQGVGQKRFLDLVSKYGASLYRFVNVLDGQDFVEMIESIQTTLNYEAVINEYIYKVLSKQHSFSVERFPVSFKTSYPELYLPEDAPEELKRLFYGKQPYQDVHIIYKLMTPKDIKNNPQWVKYLRKIDFKRSFEALRIGTYNSAFNNSNNFIQNLPLYETLESIMSREELLKLFVRFGDVLTNYNFYIDLSLDSRGIEKQIAEQTYQLIKKGKYRSYTDKDFDEEFKKQYQDIFLDENSPEKLIEAFYDKAITAQLLKENPTYIDFLENKDLIVCTARETSAVISILYKLGVSTKDVFELLLYYGQAIEKTVNVETLKNIGADNVKESIKKNIINNIFERKGIYNETYYEIIGKDCPDLFLDESFRDTIDDFESLEVYFYNFSKKTPLTFEVLKKHPHWLPALKGKNVLLSLQKEGIGVVGLQKLFERYGQDVAIRIGMKKPRVVMQMLLENQEDILFAWYDRLHFVPDYPVMKYMNLDDIDKFMASGKKWSNLMRIEEHTKNEEGVTALLKASYCFGVFDNDAEGYNRIVQMFTGIPSRLNSYQMYKVKKYLTDEFIFREPEIDNNLEECIKLIETVYYKNEEDDTYVLHFDVQQNPQKVRLIRKIMEDSEMLGLLNANKAHQLFGGFMMEYDPSFRDFLLANLDEILSSSEYIGYMSNIQRQWHVIKTINSNRALTLELALSFIKSNKYPNAEPGNERLVEVASWAGYDEKSLDILQQIYNYGKMRIFNSVPRVSGLTEGLTYEIVRLDEALPLAIGPLSDCCQKLDDHAETSMEHSMASKHGRLFVVKDTDGNIEAQSWVWRNNNIICFDNIEIPDKAFARARKRQESSEKFTKRIYDLYQKAAREISAIDHKKFEELLEQGKISQEQFDSLRVEKVTVGSGNNDIAEALEKHGVLDKHPEAPKEYETKFKLRHKLYIGDSHIQYVLDGNPEAKLRESDDDLALYPDEFVVYTNDNFKEYDLTHLRYLEALSDNRSSFSKLKYLSNENIVSEIGENYGLIPEKTRILMNANFAIIYEEQDHEIVLADILFNGAVNRTLLSIQVLLAIKQLSNSYTINSELLLDSAAQLYLDALSKEDNLDVERGIKRG